MDYAYDFGDGWSHRLTVEKVLAPEPGGSYPRCVSGRRACPPEDVGGPWGYDEFLAAMTDPAHPEHAERREWMGGPFDPAAFDLDAVERGAGRVGLAPAAHTGGSTRGGGIGRDVGLGSAGRSLTDRR